jgi:hypothetical protein
MAMIDVNVAMNNLDMLHRSENDIVITTKRKLSIEDQNVILNASTNGF